MKFAIRKIILWPKKSGLLYREIEFELNKINVITGASRTGKSALIPIVDYCLGAHKCAIPVDTIRNACAWFGVLFELENEQILLCRKEPGLKETTDEMFILRGSDISIPVAIKTNTTREAVGNILNELFSMSSLALDPSSDKLGAARPSYRDFMAFLFQPQNIVANSEVMFFKADTTEHRQKLIDVFPYALGAVTPKVLSARMELDKLRKRKERLQRDINTIRNVSESWKQEIRSWMSQARELGLTDYSEKEDESFDNILNELYKVVEKNENSTIPSSPRIIDINEELQRLRQEERKVSSELFALQKRHKEMLDLKSSVETYENSLRIQLNRLEISKWLKSLVSSDNDNPLISITNNSIGEEIDKLCNAISTIEQTASNMGTIPAAFEREFHGIEEEIAIQTERLKAIRLRISEGSKAKASDAEQKYTLNAIARFLGKLDTSLKTFERVGKDSELESQFAKVQERITELSKEINEAEIRKRQDVAIAYINQRIGEIIHDLDVEHPDNPVEFVIKDLMLKVNNENGRKDYLWEIGSASNWLSYHVATIMAFQQFFQKGGGILVPNFIIFDQPSQVYFPQHGINGDESILNATDEDKEAVKKIFSAMSAFIKRVNYSVQIIITEHADEDVWGDEDDICLVERWRGEDKKLVPLSWLGE